MRGLATRRVNHCGNSGGKVYRFFVEISGINPAVARYHFPVAQRSLLENEMDADLYRRNAFRLSGLPVDANARQVRKRSDELTAMSQLGATAAGPPGPLPVRPPPDTPTVQNALTRLRDPVLRLTDELFWFWPQRDQDPGYTALRAADPSGAWAAWLADTSSGPERRAVAVHNLAVLSHLAAVEQLEQPEFGNWATAYACWASVLDDDACWSWLADRARTINDPRAGQDVVRRLRAELPRTLLEIGTSLLLRALDRGDISACSDQVKAIRSAQLTTADVTTALDNAARKIADRARALGQGAEDNAEREPHNAAAVMAELLDATTHALTVLDMLARPGDTVRDGARDALSRHAMRCLVIYDKSGGMLQASHALLDRVRPIAASESVRESVTTSDTVIEQDLKRLRAAWSDELLYGTCWPCGVRPADGNPLELKLHGDVSRDGRRVSWSSATAKVPRCAHCATPVNGGTILRHWATVLFAVGPLVAAILLVTTGPQAAVLTVIPWLLIPAALVWWSRRFPRPPDSQRDSRDFPPVADYLGNGWALGAKPPNIS